MMLEFREPRIEDRAWVTQIMRTLRRDNCETCFGNIFCWGPVYGTGIARFEDFFLAAGTGEDGEYCFPVGRGNLRRVIDAIYADAAARGRQLRLFGITEDEKQQLEALYPGRFDFTEDRDFFDYIYSREDLASLRGKKYHGKRNHIAAFERDGDYTYERITPANIPDCLDMAAEWMKRNGDKDPQALQNEQFALRRAFAYYDALELRGALLRRDCEVIAFTVGEALHERMFDTHFEKAYADVRGAYTVINRDFAARELGDFVYINREEDTGDAGLRQAKLRYHPVRLLKKYDAVCKD